MSLHIPALLQSAHQLLQHLRSSKSHQLSHVWHHDMIGMSTEKQPSALQCCCTCDDVSSKASSARLRSSPHTRPDETTLVSNHEYNAYYSKLWQSSKCLVMCKTTYVITHHAFGCHVVSSVHLCCSLMPSFQRGLSSHAHSTEDAVINNNQQAHP